MKTTKRRCAGCRARSERLKVLLEVYGDLTEWARPMVMSAEVRSGFYTPVDRLRRVLGELAGKLEESGR